MFSTNTQNSDTLIRIGFYFGIACLVLFPIMMLAYVAFAKKQDRVHYHLRNCFPYEGFIDRDKHQDILGRVLEALVLVVSLIPAIYAVAAFNNVDVNLIIYLVFFFVLSVISAASFATLSVVPLFKPKAHLILYFVYLASVILKKTVGGISLIQFAGQYSSNGSKVIGVIVLISLVVEIILLLNPKLREWDRLVKVKNKKGEEVYARPKFFVLAYSEWTVFITSIVVDLLLTIGIYLAKVASM